MTTQVKILTSKRLHQLLEQYCTRKISIFLDLMKYFNEIMLNRQPMEFEFSNLHIEMLKTYSRHTVIKVKA
jgi:hypothetical protein